VAILGIEKVVPTLSEALAVLRVLPRAATGQAATTYTTFLCGPRRPGDADGPDEVHIVLLDNGRVDLVASEMWESLLCIRCGACLNGCPVYRTIGGHAYASPYPGPIGLLATPMMRPDDVEAARDLPHASTLCGVCKSVCPIGIDLPEMILAMRRRSVRRALPSTRERHIFELASFLFERPRLYRAFVQVVRFALWAIHALRLADAPFFAQAFGGRRVPEPTGESFRSWWARVGRKK
jgi:L-lactate dehydrogenase complex protein LldF